MKHNEQRAQTGQAARRRPTEEGSPPPHVRLHSSSAQQFGDTARLGAHEQAHEGHPVREPPATDLEAEDKQAAAPAPEELRVSGACGDESGAGLGRVHGPRPRRG